MTLLTTRVPGGPRSHHTTTHAHNHFMFNTKRRSYFVTCDHSTYSRLFINIEVEGKFWLSLCELNVDVQRYFIFTCPAECVFIYSDCGQGIILTQHRYLHVDLWGGVDISKYLNTSSFRDIWHVVYFDLRACCIGSMKLRSNRACGRYQFFKCSHFCNWTIITKTITISSLDPEYFIFWNAQNPEPESLLLRSGVFETGTGYFDVW